MRHFFVINPHAFRGGPEIRQFKNDIVSQFGGTMPFDIMVARYPRDAVCAVYRYLAKYKGEVRVYAVGGDRILHDCLNGMAHFPTAELASLPIGHASAFLRAFGPSPAETFGRVIPRSLARAIPTDVIDLGGRLALNSCAVGLPATMRRMSPKKRDGRKAPRFGRYSASSSLMIDSARTVFNRNVARQHYDLYLDGHYFGGKYASIVISNGPCLFADKITAPQARPNDGMLDIVMIKSMSALRLLSILPDYFAGRHHNHLDCIIYARACSVQIRSESPIYMSVDNETQMDLSVSLSIIPNAIKFVAPEGIGY